MEELIFRAMEKQDVARIAELERLCFRSPWSEKSIGSELKNRLAHYRVGELDGKIIAYGGMWIIFAEAHITNVAVDPNYRRRGFGVILMRHMMQIAVLRGASEMTLEVRESNLAAQNLYLSLGFEISGRRKHYYADTGEDGLIMWKHDIACSSS